MNILKTYNVPTGQIYVVEGAKGKLEFLSIGDYGKDVNLTRKEVQHQEIMPLSEKWVITISTQYECSMGCTFCDVPKVGPAKDATFNDMVGQILAGLRGHPDVRTKRLNIHFARMGEPTWNPAVLDVGKWLKQHIGPEHDVVHPVVSTMMPKHNKWLKTFIHTWMRIKNRVYGGDAGLQLSINSTNEEYKQTFHLSVSRTADHVLLRPEQKNGYSAGRCQITQYHEYEGPSRGGTIHPNR